MILLRVPLKSSISIRFFNLLNPISNVHLLAYNSFKSFVENYLSVKFVVRISGSSFPISDNPILIFNHPIFITFLNFHHQKIFNPLFIMLI